MPIVKFDRPILDNKLVITVFCALINDDVIGRLDNNIDFP